MQPSQLGPYTITALLGRGGMGAVYEGLDRGSGRAVAVKTLAAHLGDDPGLRRRFLGEIDTLKGLRHPCIVQLLAFGEEDGRPYFAMELVRGRSLEQLLRSGRTFSWRQTVDVALAVTRALKSAHDHGVVHRDLKPANLLFPDAAEGDAPVKLADFGIAKLFGSAGHTMAGMIVGTAEYMAPEQATGGPVDHRVDLYALGLVMFAMLAGRPPFHGGQATDVIHRQRTEPPPRVSSRVADVPEALDDLIDRLLAKDPARRPASALAVGRQLAVIAATAGGGTAAMPSLPTEATHTPGRSPATDFDESRRATARGTRPPGPANPGAAVDLAAPTQDFGPADTSPPPPAVIPSDGTPALPDAGTMPMPTRPDDAVPPRQRPTLPDADAGSVPTPRVTRFTTVEELDRASRAEAAARSRASMLVRGLAAAGILAAVAAAGYAVLRPPTADDLLGRIRGIAADESADLRDARPLIDRFLVEHPDDPRADEVRLLDRRLDLDSLEKRARRRRDDGAMTPLEREYRAAMAREDASPVACTAALEAILALHADDVPTAGAATAPPEAQPALWLDLVRRQIARLAPIAARERAQDVARADSTLADAAALAAEAAATDDASTRATLLGRRRALLAGIVEMYAARPHVAAAVDEARRLLGGPAPDAPPPTIPDPKP